MSTTLLDGKQVAGRVLDACVPRVRHLIDRTGIVPCLATILVGQDPASATYVKMKAKRCESVGMKSLKIEMHEATTTDQLLRQIHQLNDDPAVHGILLQHPVPHTIDETAAFEAINPAKDVDGVTAGSFGAIAFGIPSSGFGACTPAGIMTLLKAYSVSLEGLDAVVIGRSAILGKPMAMMLLNAHATVTVCHSRTKNLAEIVKRADLIVAAVGKPKFVKGDWVKPGAIVVDAGYNPGNVGDVDFEPAQAKASMITPVPGGVGPMTIATLIEHTVQAAERQLEH